MPMFAIWVDFNAKKVTDGEDLSNPWQLNGVEFSGWFPAILCLNEN